MACLALIAVAVVLIFMLKQPEIQPVMSAEDFDLRLSQMANAHNAQELAEISTSVINAKKEDFEALSGWYSDVDVLDNEVLKKMITLWEDETEVTLSFEDGRVSSVDYWNEEAIFDNIVDYVAYSQIGENLSITTFEGTESVTVESEDAATELLVDAIVNRENVSMHYRYDYTNKNGDAARIRVSFSISPLGMDDLYFSSTDFSLRNEE